MKDIFLLYFHILSMFDLIGLVIPNFYLSSMFAVNVPGVIWTYSFLTLYFLIGLHFMPGICPDL